MPNKHLFLLLLSIFVVRLWVSDLLPLMDTSEARYGEMARKMVESGNWITPMFTNEEPFWGKPPLSFWSQALSISLFGESEWVTRLPSFIFHILSCYLIFVFLKKQSSVRHGLIACIMYSSTALGFMASGVVLTDPALNFSILLSFFGFWFFVQTKNNLMAYLGFTGLGLGLLAKGPIALVLFMMPVAFWIAINHKWKLLFTIPWVRGLTITSAIALPWYWMAEQATPGFIDYFIIGEHFNRYLVSDWAGDRYGDAHARPLGTIWLFLVLALFPWLFYGFVPKTWRAIKAVPSHEWKTFLWCWALMTPAFFSLAGNILWTYLLPSLAPWIILLSYRFAKSDEYQASLIPVSMLVPVLVLIFSLNGSPTNNAMNQKPVVNYWKEQQADNSLPLFYFYKRLYSGEYYSQGHAKHINDVSHLPTTQPFYLAIRLKDLKQRALPMGVDCEQAMGPKIINQTVILKCERIL